MPGHSFSIVASALTRDPRAAPALARRAGFSGLEFDAISPQLRLSDLSRTGQRDFLHQLAADEQHLIALRADLGPKGFSTGADVDRLLSQLEKILQITADLMRGQAPLLCLDVGTLPPPPAPKARPRVTVEQAGALILPGVLLAAPAPEITSKPIPADIDPVILAQLDAAFAELGALCERFGVTCAFRSELASMAAIHQILRRANCAWFALDFDPVAALRDDWDLDQIFSDLGPFIRHVRARDANRGAEHRTRAAVCGQGDVQWPALLANLRDSNYSGWITLDPLELPDRLAAAAAGLAYLKKL